MLLETASSACGVERSAIQHTSGPAAIVRELDHTQLISHACHILKLILLQIAGLIERARERVTPITHAHIPFSIITAQPRTIGNVPLCAKRQIVHRLPSSPLTFEFSSKPVNAVTIESSHLPA